MTLSRFRIGLNDAIRKELVLRGIDTIDTLDQAYTLVQDYELITQNQIYEAHKHAEHNH